MKTSRPVPEPAVYPILCQQCGELWPTTDPDLRGRSLPCPRDASTPELREAIARGFAPRLWDVLLPRHRDRLYAKADAAIAVMRGGQS